MKFKYILPVVAAVAIAAGCTTELPGDLANLSVDKSYVAIPTEGGSTTIKVTANDTWTFDVNVEVTEQYLDDVKGILKKTVEVSQLDQVDWLTVSPTSGSVGTTDVTFSANSTTSARTATLLIQVGDDVQYINITQEAGEAAEVQLATVAEVLAGTDGKTYRVQGTCTSIASTTYGNWYLKDSEGNTLYIYGTKDETGAYNWSAMNIAVGDLVTVEGPRLLYGSTLELVDVQVISVTKALLLSDETDKTIGKEAEPFTLTLTQKGSGITWESDSDWLSISNGYSVSGSDYVFTVTPTENNTGESRKGNLTFKSTKGSQSSEFTIAVTQLATVANTTDGLAGLAAEIATGTSKARVSFDYVLTDAKVTFKSGSNIFIEDATGGLLIYSSEVKLSVGDVVNGRVFGEGYAYSNLPEATSFDYSMATVTSGDAPAPTEVTFDELYNNYDKYISRYIVVKAKMATLLDAKYSAVASHGAIAATDADLNAADVETIALRCQSSGKFNGSSIYFYLYAPQGSTIDIVTTPVIYGTTKQLYVWGSSYVTVAE